MAGGLGFEPRLAESESAVLPLDDPPTRPWPRRARGASSLTPCGGEDKASAAAKAIGWMQKGADFADGLHPAKVEGCAGFVSFDQDFVKAVNAPGGIAVGRPSTPDPLRSPLARFTAARKRRNIGFNGRVPRKDAFRHAPTHSTSRDMTRPARAFCRLRMPSRNCRKSLGGSMP